MDFFSVIKDALGGSGFARVNVGDDSDVANPGYVYIA
jgi:hypothetical protein